MGVKSETEESESRSQTEKKSKRETQHLDYDENNKDKDFYFNLKENIGETSCSKIIILQMIKISFNNGKTEKIQQ